MDMDDDPTIPPEELDLPPEAAAETVTGRVPEPAPHASARPELTDSREPVYRESRGYRLRLEPPDLARLRELAGSRGKSDAELGETFFDGQAERIAESIAADVSSPAEVRVVVDPYSRQAFIALDKTIVGILSF